jgi:hypothetical protein
MPKLLIALFLLGLISCNSPKTLSGYYRSNFAIIGFFGTHIMFKTSDSLQFVFEGDMIYDSTVGSYRIFKNKLYVLFKRKDFDSNIVTSNIGHFNMPVKIDTVFGYTFPYQHFWYIGKNKLFATNEETGKKIMKESGYHKRKKYILFGSHYYYKKYYLKKVN